MVLFIYSCKTLWVLHPDFTYFCFENTKIVEIFTFSLFANFFTLLYSFIHYKLFILAKLLPCYLNPLVIIL